MNALASSLGWPMFRTRPEAFLAAAWCLPAAAFAGFLSIRLGIWTFSATTLLLLGAPAILLLGRVLIWGWAFAAFLENASLVLLAALGFTLDLLLLALSGVAFRLDSRFLFTEIFAIGICLVPAQLFARWTREGQHLAARNLMHLVFHAALLLVTWPSLIMQLFGGDWRAWAERSSTANKFYLQLLFIPCVLLITAMQEFQAAGRGTPMPQDAPQNLVTTGVYAYVANPMQIGKFGVLFGWGLFWKNPWFVTVAFLGLLYSVSIARWREDRDLAARFGATWSNYRRHVPLWLPRWRPWIANSSAQDLAVLYLDLNCGPCAILARWLVAQRPTELRILPLSAHLSNEISRITYRPAGTGQREEYSLSAIARSLGHIHLAWAFCGWMLRLPLIAWTAKLITDAVNPARANHCRPLPSHPSV